MKTREKVSDGSCESCMMPFSKDATMREHPNYCSYCFNNGKLCYEGNDVHEFKQAMVDAIVTRGEPRWKAKLFAFMAGFAPRWKGHNNFFGNMFGSHAKNCEKE
jgi:hypothetical protein